MQSVSSTFETDSKKKNRNISAEFSVDWNADGEFTDETVNLKLVEIERKVNEPLGGIHTAQFDVKLSNMTDRYTPGSSSPIVSYLTKGRRGSAKLGFGGDNIVVCNGRSEVPHIWQDERYADFHFFDETNHIFEHKLTGGGKLYLDVRSDLYIWDILDEVYRSFFQVIASCDASESWVGSDAEIINHRGGDEAVKITSVSASEEKVHTDPGTALDFSAWGESDHFNCFLYIDDVTKVDRLIVRLHTIVDEAWFDLDLTLENLVTGWNEIQVNKSSFIGADITWPSTDWFTIGTSDIESAFVIPPKPTDWSVVARVEIILQATTGDDVYVIFDELRFTDQYEYPRRFFDIGLQIIPVASWDGNTALYEIKVACESEGARFFADENGNLHFENRQHYNNYPQYKVSSASRDFSNILEFEHVASEQGIVNSVSVLLNPRKLVAEKEVWRYPYTVSIAAGATKQIWASFVDPVPTTATGFVTPVATTDYTANDDEFGTGTNRTASISIVTTKFVRAGLLEVTNGHTGAVYLTMLKIRGTPAETSDEVRIKRTDASSIATYGELPAGGLVIDSRYLSDEVYAEALADQIITWYKDPLERIVVKCMALPHLQIGDMITISNNVIGVDFLMRIMGIKLSESQIDGMIQELQLRTVNPFETLTFFEIGTSSIENVDVISQ